MGGGFIHIKLKKIQMNLHKLIARAGTDKKKEENLIITFNMVISQTAF